MGLLEGKKIVITGVMTDASLAFGVARIALDEGAEIVLTGVAPEPSPTGSAATPHFPEVGVWPAQLLESRGLAAGCNAQLPRSCASDLGGYPDFTETGHADAARRERARR